MLPLLLTIHAAPSVQANTQTPVTVSIFAETYTATEIVDPTLTIGRELNITVAANNIPPIIDASQGGLAGFDLSLSYNSTMLKVVDSGLQSPFCSASDGCLYARASTSQIVILNNTVDSANGVARSAMIVSDPNLRAVGQGVLIKFRFKILALGLTPISIIQNVSQLYGFSDHCGQFLSYTSAGLSLDNRRPYRLVASPPSISISPGQSGSVNVTLSRVNSAGDGNVTLLLSGIRIGSITYGFIPRTSRIDGSRGILSFNSNLTIFTSPNTPKGTYHLEIVAQLDSITLNQFDQARLNFTLYVGYPVGPPVLGPVGLHSSQTPYVNLVSPSVPGNPPLPLTGTFIIAGPAVAGVPVTFTPNICGGTAPFEIAWKFGEGNATTVRLDGPGTGPSISHRYAAAGSYQIIMTIRDAAGRTSTTSQTILVSEASRASPLVGTTETGIILLSFFLLISLLYLRRRYKSHR
jgi:hypothetical protein